MGNRALDVDVGRCTASICISDRFQVRCWELGGLDGVAQEGGGLGLRVGHGVSIGIGVGKHVFGALRVGIVGEFRERVRVGVATQDD
eukprot:326022-Alexandrium_andersonii.AAC.1